MADTPLPLTDSQQGLLIIDRMVRRPQLYNTVSQIDLAPIDEGRLRSALTALIAVQPALRTVLVESPTPHGVLTEPPAPADLPLDVVDLTSEPGGDHVTAVADAVRDLGQHAFDLLGGVLCRFVLVRGADRATLLVLAHHLIFDGFSLEPLVRDLTRLLADEIRAPELAALRERREQMLRAELAVQQRTATDAKTRADAEEWAAALRGRDAGVVHPRPHRPAETRFAGHRIGWVLDDAESAAVQARCRDWNVSPFVLFAGVYGAVLARHCGGRTALIGSPFMSRRTAGSLDLCGFFVNTLPISFDVDWDSDVAGYLREVAGPAVDFSRSRSNVPFSTLVQHLRPDRSTNRNPVFSHMIVLQDAPSRSQAIRAVREHGNGTAKFDVWLGVTADDGRWSLELEYDEQLLPAAAAEDLASSLRTALRRALTGDPARVRDLFADESLDASRATDGYWHEPPSPSLTGWLRDTTAWCPGAIAVEGDRGSLTYRELDEQAGRAAAGLSALGVGAGDVVGLSLDDLADTVIAMLAIMRCGAAYLPLDTSLPTARLDFMARRSGCRLVIGSVEVPGCRMVGVDELTADLDELAAAEAADGSVYVMFSSGSTGEPKGIEMHGPPLLNLTAWQVAALDMGRGTRFLQYAPLGFDVSFQEIIPTLVAGGTVVSREPVDRRDFPALVQRIQDTAVTHVYLPVAALRPFVQAAQELDLSFDHLRYLCVSGEQLVLDGQEHKFFVRHPHCTLVNLYGPTETHAVTTHRLPPADEPWPAHAPIGLPLTGVTAYVVDVTGHLAPNGVPGELYLGGRCPARGYINAPDRTAESFLADRFAGSGTMYRTGDQVMRDSPGTLIFLGRNDDQVKIRGYRVELGELEAVANAADGVRQAVAAVRETPGGRELVLFAVSGRLDADQIRAQIRQVLPAYMVPAWVFLVDKVPATINGKSDRSALLAEVESRISAQVVATAGEEPSYQDELERELAELWATLIHQEGLAPDRSLLECGAHSLTVFQALAKVRQRYGVVLPITEFFRSPTIATIAVAIRAGRTEAGAS